MSDNKREARIRLLFKDLHKKLDDLKAVLTENENSLEQDFGIPSDGPFDCTLGEYIERKRSTHGNKMKGLPFFTSFMNESREINTVDSGSESIKYFRDVPMNDFILIPACRLLKYRLLGKKSISVLKDMVLEDGGVPHRSW
jgi:hypothetical protein